MACRVRHPFISTEAVVAYSIVQQPPCHISEDPLCSRPGGMRRVTCPATAPKPGGGAGYCIARVHCGQEESEARDALQVENSDKQLSLFDNYSG